MPATTTYTVVPGDTLYGLSKRFGMTVNDLISLNGLASNNLSVGQTLRIHSNAATPPPPPPSQPSTNWGSSSGSTPTGGGAYAAARQQFRVQPQPDAGFKRYAINVPLLSGGSVTASMRDNLTNSSHMVYPGGIMYNGQSSIELNVGSIQSVGLNASTARALQYVSTHEGKFDAINSYDRAIFSYGFIQFAGGAAQGGSLNRLLASMKANAPGAFSRVFQNVGIDVAGNNVKVADERGNWLQGDQAWLYIQKTLPLYGAFIQAGYEPSLVLEQLRMANALYVQPAMAAKLSLNIAGSPMTAILQDIFTSEGFRTIAIAVGINRGIGGMSRDVVAPAASQVATRTGVSDLRQIDERAVAQQIANTTTEDRVRKRVQGVLDSSLSFNKAGWWG